jgi:hypothetical protein
VADTGIDRSVCPVVAVSLSRGLERRVVYEGENANEYA